MLLIFFCFCFSFSTSCYFFGKKKQKKRSARQRNQSLLTISFIFLQFQAHVVAAFEQSLTNMTQRLQQLSATADRKDSELTEMRQTIELLRKQSIQAGLTSAHMHSMNEQPRPVETIHVQPPAPRTTISSAENPATATTAMQRHLSSDSMCSLNSVSSGCSTQDKKTKKKGWVSDENVVRLVALRFSSNDVMLFPC